MCLFHHTVRRYFYLHDASIEMETPSVCITIGDEKQTSKGQNKVSDLGDSPQEFPAFVSDAVSV